MYKRILVAIDGSDTSNKALAAAIHQAKETHGCVRLVHVLEELSYLTGFGQYGGYSSDLVKIMRDTGAEILEAGLALAKAAGVEADSVLHDRVDERLADVLADEARRWNADLVVVGTHGRRGVGRILLGSGAEQIIRLSPVPVLVIRSQEPPGPLA